LPGSGRLLFTPGPKRSAPGRYLVAFFAIRAVRFRPDSPVLLICPFVVAGGDRSLPRYNVS